MPPRSTPPPANKPPRRRPVTVMPGSWIWLVILAMLVGMLLLTSFGNSGTIAYSDFLKLIKDKNLTKITFVGNDRVLGEVKDLEAETLPEDVKTKLRNNKKFTTLLPPGENKDLRENISKLAVEQGVKVE